MSVEVPFAEFVERLGLGDEDAWTSLYEQYEPRLRRVARSRLNVGLRTRVESDEPVQSAFKSVFRHLKDEALDLSDPDHLERLLVQVTLRKAVNHAKHHRRRLRDVRREDRGRAAGGDEYGGSILDRLAQTRELSPDEELLFQEQLDRLVDSLPEDLRVVLRLKLKGFKNQEVADEKKISLSSVERKLRRIRSHWKTAVERPRGEGDRPRRCEEEQP